MLNLGHNKISSYIKANPSKRITIQSIPSIFDASRGVKTLLHPRCQCFHDSKNFRAPPHKMSKKQKLPTISEVFSRNKFTKHVSQNLSRKNIFPLTKTTKCLTGPTLAIYHLWWAPKLRGPVVSRGVSQSACVPPLSQMGETDGPSDPLNHPNSRSLNS